MIESDIGFIVDSWLESWHQGSEMKRVRFRYFKMPCRERILKLLRTNNVLVAVDQEKQDHIFGYVVYNSDVIHYIYVLSTRRRTGLATELVKQAEIPEKFYYTHSTRLGARIASSLSAEYNPCILW